MLIVSVFLVYLWTSEEIAPTASPGFLGTAKELKSKSFDAEIPKSKGKLLKAKGFVSWNTTSHFLPY
jgi:hypothetical protein